MEYKFEELISGIYRLCVPFENIYTSVFAVVDNNRCILIDSASSEEDVYNYVLPALKPFNWNIEWLVLSHFHNDHSGGITALKKNFINAKVGMFYSDFANTAKSLNCHFFKNEEELFKNIKVLFLPGHSEDSLGVLDMRSNTLLTFDSLQLRGVGRYGTIIYSANSYYNTLERLLNIKISNIITSHNYVPLGFFAKGKNNVTQYINECKNIALNIEGFVRQNLKLSNNEIVNAFNKQNDNLPPIFNTTVQSFKEKINGK